MTSKGHSIWREPRHEIMNIGDVTQGKTDVDLLPLTFVSLGRIQGNEFDRPLIALLDSGSTKTWFNKKSMPEGVQGISVPSETGTTLAGSFKSNEQVCLQDLAVPELLKSTTLPKCSARVFHAPCRYDLIVGRDLLSAFGVSLDFDKHLVKGRDGLEVGMRPYPEGDMYYSPVMQLMLEVIDADTFGNDEGYMSSDDECFAAEIKDSKYDPAKPAKAPT